MMAAASSACRSTNFSRSFATFRTRLSRASTAMRSAAAMSLPPCAISASPPTPPSWARSAPRPVRSTAVGGDKGFCTGGDESACEGKYEGRGIVGLPIDERQSSIRDIPKPVIARSNGYAIGGGHVFATLCDLSIAADTAKLGQVGPKVGSFDGGWGTALLARHVGDKKAREIWYLNIDRKSTRLNSSH